MYMHKPCRPTIILTHSQDLQSSKSHKFPSTAISYFPFVILYLLYFYKQLACSAKTNGITNLQSLPKGVIFQHQSQYSSCRTTQNSGDSVQVWLKKNVVKYASDHLTQSELMGHNRRYKVNMKKSPCGYPGGRVQRPVQQLFHVFQSTFTVLPYTGTSKAQL